MKNYISRHRKQNTAQKKCQTEALKHDRKLFVVSDNKWLYVVSDPDQHEIIYEYEPEPHVCQHTGLKIPRNRKNHTKVSELLKQAYESNAPRASYAIKLALWAGRDEQGFTTIEEFISYGQGVLKKEEEQYEKQRATWSADKRLSVRRRLEKKDKRKEKNRWLRAHGYHWRKKEIEVEEKWGPSTYQRWQLYAPDGREVSVAQASLEIEPQPQPNQNEEAEKGTREQAGHEYSAFRAKHLTGLSMSHAYPEEAVEWEQIAYFDRDTPGAFITGDTWYVGQIDGEAVYRRSHGYATEIYAPPSIIDQLVEANYSLMIKRDGKIKAARWVIERQGQGCIGDDIATRLIELRGIQYFAKIAGLDQSLVVSVEEEDFDSLPF